MALHTQSVVKAYIHNPVVRQRLGAPTHAVNAQKKEINRLRIEAGHYRFIIEREAAQKARNDLPAPVSPHDLRLQAAAVRRDQAESLRNERTQLQGEVEYFKGLLQRRL